MYIDLYSEFRKSKDNDKENINDDLVFEMELIKQVDINIDYILELIKKYHDSQSKDKEILADINKAIDSSFELRNKKELIKEFVNSLDAKSEINEDWISFVSKKKVEQLERIAEEEDLDLEEARTFMNNAFRDGHLYTTGTSLAKILPPISRFSKEGERSKKREGVIEKFIQFFNRFYDISNGL